jgi:pimeloyl-ACP methyl ester carboxylesterase
VTAVPRAEGLPPRRFECSWTGGSGRWVYDRWGNGGRPVLLLHGPLFDRTMWWPVAAELAETCTVVTVDLPGHGDTRSSRQCNPSSMLADLAALLDDLGRRMAPVVAGHSLSGVLAAMFAANFHTRAVVVAGQTLDLRHQLADLAATAHPAQRLLAGLDSRSVPPAYRSLAAPTPDDGLLAEHLRWASRHPPAHVHDTIEAALRRIRAPLVSISGDAPSAAYLGWLRRTVPDVRCVTYDRPGPFPHLQDVPRFAADLARLLQPRDGPPG